MKKISFVIVLLLIFVSMGYSGSINVRLVPDRSRYPVDSYLTIYWDYSGIGDSEVVKITIWKENAEHVSCRIADDVPITKGRTGYSWKIYSRCTNPRTNSPETLSGNIKIRVRWKHHNVFGESRYFKLYFTATGFWNVSYAAKVAPGFIDFMNVRMSEGSLSYDSDFLERYVYEYNFEVISGNQNISLPIRVLVDNLRDRELEGKLCVVPDRSHRIPFRFRMELPPSLFNITVPANGWRILEGGTILIDKEEIRNLCGSSAVITFEVFVHDKDSSCNELRGTLSEKKTLKIRLLFPREICSRGVRKMIRR